MRFGIIASVLFLIILINVAYAEEEEKEIGPFTLGEEVILPQDCANCTFVNISNIIGPNSSIIFSGGAMTYLGGTSYSFSLSGGNITSLGRYIVSTYGNPDGVLVQSSYDFYVTKSGEKREINVFIPLVPILFFGIVCLIISFVVFNDIIKYTLYAFTVLSAYVAVQYTLIVIQGYALTDNLSTNSFLETFFQVFTWIIGGATVLIIVWIFIQLKKLIEIKKGFREY